MVTIIATRNVLTTIGLLITLGSASSAISQEVPPEVRSCKTMADDKQRLRCFDRLFGTSAKTKKFQEGKQARWSIEETKSSDRGIAPFDVELGKEALPALSR